MSVWGVLKSLGELFGPRWLVREHDDGRQLYAAAHAFSAGYHHLEKCRVNVLEGDASLTEAVSGG